MIELINSNSNLNYKQALKGDKGDNGASAYEVAVNNGFGGTEQDWLLSLKGKDGKDGKNGEKGEKGDKGAKGDTGARGADGAKGETGAKGDKGDTGAPFTFDMFTPEQLEALKGEKGEKGDTGEAGASKPTVKSMLLEGDWENFALNASIQDAEKGIYNIDVLAFDWAGMTLFDNKIIVGVYFMVNNNEYDFQDWFTTANNNINITPLWDFMNNGYIVARLTNCEGSIAENVFNGNHSVTGIKVRYIEVSAE